VAKRAKAMPAKQLVKIAAAGARYVERVSKVNYGPVIVPSLLEYAAGKPERLREEFPDLAQALEVKPAKSAGRRAS
jgi:hypothetical protein